MTYPTCPKCAGKTTIKSGVLNKKQRYKCKTCSYHFTVQKIGKQVDPYYVIKALQLVLEGVSYREIERILGVSHVSVLNWVHKYGIKVPENHNAAPEYKILTHNELQGFFGDRSEIVDSSMIVTEISDKFLVIRWRRRDK